MHFFSLNNKWISFNQKYHKVWEFFLINIMCLAFILSDWMLGIFSFSDYLFVLIFLLLMFSNNFRIKTQQCRWIAVVFGITVVNVAQNMLLNDIFNAKAGVAGVCKITFYTIVITSFYNFIIKRKLERELLKKMNLFAVIVCAIGIYISVALYTIGELPYEFFWHFTRTDSVSYLFEGSNGLYRVRSIFSEPSYLGYYLTIILGINLFNQLPIKSNKYFILLITITIILTFSYSSIGIMLLIFVLQLFSKETFKEIKHKKINYLYVLLFLIVVSILLFITKDIIQVTLIERTRDILAGKDSSASARLLESWQYVNTANLIRGNGIGHTPDIWNIYAYLLSDLGTIAFIASILFSAYLVKINYKLGILFVALNFQKGGYLAAPFYILILLVFIFMRKKDE